MNKIKYSILLITALCISFGNGFAQVNDNSTTVKTGTGSFNASILRPLTVHNVVPEPLTNQVQEFVRGASYSVWDETLPFPGVPAFFTYTIRGEANKSVYIKVLGPTVDNAGRQSKTDQDVTVTFIWKVQNGSYQLYDGATVPHNLSKAPSEDFGKVLVTAQLETLVIGSGAPSGLRTFLQIIEVSYNSF